MRDSSHMIRAHPHTHHYLAPYTHHLLQRQNRVHTHKHKHTRARKTSTNTFLLTESQREETPEKPFTDTDRKDLKFLYDEWAHPYFISIQV